MSMSHWEVDQEDFLLLRGEALLVVEGEERPLRAWDLVHCPGGTRHVIVGAGEAPVPSPFRRRPRPLDPPRLGREHRGRRGAAPATARASSG